MPQPGSSRTFPVSRVTPSERPQPLWTARQALESVLGGPIESCSESRRMVESGADHFLVGAAQLAFQHHYTLVLSPDMLRLTMLQGVAQHIKAHADELRARLVKHQGKMELNVRRDDFVKGAFENPWDEVFASLVQQMGDVFKMVSSNN